MKPHSEDLPQHLQLCWTSLPVLQSHTASGHSVVAASGWCRQRCWAGSPGDKLRVLSEWQRPVAGDLVKLLTRAYVINRRALAATSEADGLRVRCFPPGPEAAPVTMVSREPHLAPVVPCTPGCAREFPLSLRSLGERLGRIRVLGCARLSFSFCLLLTFQPTQKILCFSVWVRCSAFLPFIKTIFFFLKHFKR